MGDKQKQKERKWDKQADGRWRVNRQVEGEQMDVEANRRMQVEAQQAAESKQWASKKVRWQRWPVISLFRHLLQQERGILGHEHCTHTLAGMGDTIPDWSWSGLCRGLRVRQCSSVI